MFVRTAYIGYFLVSTGIALIVCVHVARTIHKSGVEQYSSRLLLLSALIDTILIAFMLLLCGFVGLLNLLRSGQSLFAAAPIVLLLFVLPVRSLWNYATVNRRIAQRLDLRPCSLAEHRAEVTTLARIMDIAVPLVRESMSLQTPIVYGVRSKKAYLAIPGNWNAINARSRQVMLCHELAHIKNRDVGFLTWAYALLCDLKWMPILAPGFIIFSSLGDPTFLPQMVFLYVLCLCILWILTNAVVKRRELLADRTVAMLIDSEQVRQAIDTLPLTTPVLPCTSKRSLDRLAIRVQHWLADKALFSARPMIWKVVLRFVATLFPAHPSIPARIRAIAEQKAVDENSSTDRTEAFFIGVTFGLLGIFIALAGFWTGRFLLRWENTELTERLGYVFLGCTAPIAIGCIALFFVLPTWASVRLSAPTLQRLWGFAGRYLFGLLGASSVSPLILVGGWWHIEIKVLFVLHVVWVCLILVFAACVNLVMLFLWRILRHKRRYLLTDLQAALYSYGLGVLCIFGCLALGVHLMTPDRALAGASVVFGTFAGLAVLAFTATGCISGTEQYIASRLGSKLIRLEGGAYLTWSPFVGSLQIVAGLIPAAAVSLSVYGLGYLALRQVGHVTATAILIAFICMILLAIERYSPRRPNDSSTRKVGALTEALTIFESHRASTSPRLAEDLLAGFWDATRNSRGIGIMTTTSLFELTTLVPASAPLGNRLCNRICQWTTDCETHGGFGVWPHSTPRLASTYQCLRMLKRTGRVAVAHAESHISWIFGLQQSEGYFRGPWSKRVDWEDTFFAVASLDILDADWPSEARATCLKWTKHALEVEGIRHAQSDALHCCLAILQMLKGLDDDMVTAAAKHLSVQMAGLLLTNVAHNAESVCHAIQAWHILDKRGMPILSSEQKRLFADRIHTALEAELVTLRT